MIREAETFFRVAAAILLDPYVLLVKLDWTPVVYCQRMQLKPLKETVSITSWTKVLLTMGSLVTRIQPRDIDRHLEIMIWTLRLHCKWNGREDVSYNLVSITIYVIQWHGVKTLKRSWQDNVELLDLCKIYILKAQFYFQLINIWDMTACDYFHIF